MAFIIILIIVVVIVFAVKGGKSGSDSPVEQTSEQQISWVDRTPEELDERNELFNSLMQGDNSKELTKCYNKIKSLFIPKDNGQYAGSLSGLLSETSRAKTLASTNETVARILGDDTQEYAVWYDVFFDNMLNDMYYSSNGKLAQFTHLVIEDVQRGDALLEQAKVVDILSDPENADSSTKVYTDEATIKIKTKTKNGKLHYEIKGAYKSFKYGLCLDDELIRRAEILMTICAKYEYGPKYELHKDDVEKYALPNLRNQ